MTDEITGDPGFLPGLRKRHPCQRPRFAATSVVKNTLRMLRGDRLISHVSSPGGMGGGMDARFTDKGWWRRYRAILRSNGRSVCDGTGRFACWGGRW